MRGIQELSDRFTTDRDDKLGSYLSHPKNRSSYLLYFFPLQCAKFLTLFNRELPRILEVKALGGALPESLKILDLGSGPGTASIAFVLWLQTQSSSGREIPKEIEFHWVDTQKNILKDGETLLKEFCDSFPKLRDRIKIKTHVAPLWNAPLDHYDLVLAGNVLNETSSRLEWLERIYRKVGPLGLLLLEPADRTSSQKLSRLRDQWLAQEIISEKDGIWAPCLHAGICPMAQGRDWCHTSIRQDLTLEWFRDFSRGLGSERQWLKFSYLWLASSTHGAIPIKGPDPVRVLSDSLGEGAHEVLICRPETAEKVFLTTSQVGRGDLVLNLASLLRSKVGSFVKSGKGISGSRFGNQRGGRLGKGRKF